MINLTKKLSNSLFFSILMINQSAFALVPQNEQVNKKKSSKKTHTRSSLPKPKKTRQSLADQEEHKHPVTSELENLLKMQGYSEKEIQEMLKIASLEEQAEALAQLKTQASKSPISSNLKEGLTACLSIIGVAVTVFNLFKKKPQVTLANFQDLEKQVFNFRAQLKNLSTIASWIPWNLYKKIENYQAEIKSQHENLKTLVTSFKKLDQAIDAQGRDVQTRLQVLAECFTQGEKPTLKDYSETNKKSIENLLEFVPGSKEAVEKASEKNKKWKIANAAKVVMMQIVETMIARIQEITSGRGVQACYHDSARFAPQNPATRSRSHSL